MWKCYTGAKPKTFCRKALDRTEWANTSEGKFGWSWGANNDC